MREAQFFGGQLGLGLIAQPCSSREMRGGQIQSFDMACTGTETASAGFADSGSLRQFMAHRLQAFAALGRQPQMHAVIALFPGDGMTAQIRLVVQPEHTGIAGLHGFVQYSGMVLTVIENGQHQIGFGQLAAGAADAFGFHGFRCFAQSGGVHQRQPQAADLDGFT